MKIILFILFTYCIHSDTWAEKGVIVIQVSDLNARPIKGIVFSTKGDGGITAPTDNFGKTRLRVPVNLKQGTHLSLVIISSFRNSFVFISPWDGDIIVPSFENSPGNFVSIFLTEKGDRAMLQSDKAITAVINKTLRELDNSNERNFNRLNSKMDSMYTINEKETKLRILEEQAKSFGLTAEEVDKAIRTWKVNDFYSRGLKALYEEKYVESTTLLISAYEENTKNRIDILFNLSTSLLHQGLFMKAEQRLREAVALKPFDSKILFEYAIIWEEIGNCDSAKFYCERAYELDEKEFGNNNLKLSNALFSLIRVYCNCNDLNTAQKYGIRVIKLFEENNASEDLLWPLNLLASIYLAKNDYINSDFYLTKAKQIQQSINPNSPPNITIENSLAMLRFYRGLWNQADSMLKGSVTQINRIIKEDGKRDSVNLNRSVLNDIISTYNYQNQIAYARGKFDSVCEIRLKLILKYVESAYGNGSPGIYLGFLQELGDIYRFQNRYLEAEKIFKVGFDLITKTRGYLFPDLFEVHHKLITVLLMQNKNKQADSIATQMIDSLTTKTVNYSNMIYLESLNDLLRTSEWQGDYSKAANVVEKMSLIADKSNDQNLFKKVIIWKTDLLAQQNRVQEAIELLKSYNVDTNYESSFDIQLQNQYAKLTKITKNFKVAELCYIKSIQLANKLYSNQKMVIVEQISLLGDLYLEMGDTLNGENQYRKCERIISELRLPDSFNIITVLNKLASLYLKMGDNFRAYKELDKCIRIINNVECIIDPFVARTYNNVSRLYLVSKNLKKANELSDEAMKILMQSTFKYSDLGKEILMQRISVLKVFNGTALEINELQMQIEDVDKILHQMRIVKP